MPLGGVARSLVLVGGATALGQGAIVLAAPILARLYDPADFGLLSVYAALLMVLVSVASFRFDFAIPIARDPDEALHLLVLSVAIALVTSIGVAVVIGLAGPVIAASLGAATLAPALWLLPIALAIAGAGQAIAAWAVYRRSFTELARMRTGQGIGQAILQVVLGLAHAGPFGLILGDLGGRLVGVEQFVRPLGSALRSARLSVPAVIRYGRARWSFAGVMTVASLLNALSLQVPFLLIPVLFDLPSSGQYFLAYRILVLPASLVSAAVSQVFLGEASHRRADPRRLHDLAINATVSLFVFAIPSYGVVAVGGPALINAIFGSQWTVAGEYARFLAPWLLISSVASPISSLLLIGRRERESLAFTASELALKTGSLLVGAMVGSLAVGIVALSFISVLINIGALWRFLRVASASLGELVRPVARIAIVTPPALLTIAVLSAVRPELVPVASVAGWAISFGVAARSSPETRAFLAQSDG